ncbi:uncharacterized protein LOC105834196 isoform X3 [Monomorium pharaonis]|uniref:uncharacterized protein LOC105834196 isoform X3 n=1 Tax=Monomorium pharaonis TaxID=307658 RepID=UPI001746A783|nr:uncharacterized protein LOC105834196 isoform X3 [Monomorium pharaonis]
MDESTTKFVQNDTDVLTASIPFTESPRKCNLSFSINFDFNDVNSENSTDSENADLQIDISEVDNYEPSSKHKRETVEEASVLNEMEEEIERQLDAEAAKTNLTATNVKNILKHVIPYEHLMTMVQKWLQDTENDIGPKLTRAKAKKLAAAKVNIPWPITTAQNTSSEVQALIQEELPEDSSDEEYNPEHDKQSDDDKEVEHTSSSDINTQLLVTTHRDVTSSEQKISHIQYDSKGVFKIPAIPQVTEEESIGQRTRSKLSLSETSLEEIEQAFVPPDITADMTEDWECEHEDEDWDNFLKEFTQPLTQEPTMEDDPEADPEYNILEDEETDLLDKEELRTDRAVEVPRKEQYDLIAELLELTLMFSTQEQEEVSKKRKVVDNTIQPIESNTMKCSVVPALAEPELPALVNFEQRLLLATQFQQHVQLMAQHFVMTYMHPEYHMLAKQKEEKMNSAKSTYILDSYNFFFEKQGIIMNSVIKSYPSIPNNHLLRNPVVNMLPKLSPAISNSKALPKTDNLFKRSCKFNDTDGGKVLDNNIHDTEAHKRKTAAYKVHTNFCTSKVNISDVKPTQTDKLLDKNNTKLNTMLTKSSKISKKSPQIESPELPQIRRTTPRLAKTKSAQNMKLMAQALGSKNSSNCGILKSKEKDITDKNIDESSSTSKVDNEEEIAELMLASSTIIKDPINRKKAKQTRELEIIKRLLKAENPLTEEEREAKFAASFLQKLHLILESNNPETFKAVIKLYLDYSEKLESINNTIIDPLITDGSEQFVANKQTLEDSAIKKDTLTVQLYQEVCKKLQNYPEICTDFLLFLKPYQAAMIGKSIEYMMLQKMNDFVHVAQIYFAKQPSRIAKMMQAITQLSSDPHTTLENVYTVMSSVFKGHPLVMDLFLQILPTAKPPESLLAPHMFENMTCPLGPYDKNTTYTENASELYENIELSTSTYQEDPYGGENCKCDCHNTDETSLKNNFEHCVSCGTRFLNGRIYLQTPEGLRPAKITFPGEDQEKLEHIARISLKINDKAVPQISSKKRRKSSKNDSNHEDICQKQCTKYSPLKNNENNEKEIIKSKRNVKFSLKTNHRKILKRIDTVDHAITEKRMRISQCKNKREKKTEENDTLLELNELDLTKQEKTNKIVETKTKTQLLMQDTSLNVEIITKTQMFSNISNDTGCNSNKNTEIGIVTKMEDNKQLISDLIDDKPWTRQEDMILLQSIKKEYSENAFLLISEKLQNRTVDQVRERCQTLLSLLQKMM